jgi:RHS repeat-associated protein
MELDETGLVISYEEYHPYGTTAYHAVASGVEVSAKRYRYTGKEKDEETGLYYHGARHYAPWLGRWTSADPAGLVDGVNLYRYGRNRPVVLIDPTGLDPVLENDPRTLEERNESYGGKPVEAVPLLRAIDDALGTVQGKSPLPRSAPVRFGPPGPSCRPLPQAKPVPEVEPTELRPMPSENAEEFANMNRLSRLLSVASDEAEYKQLGAARSYANLHGELPSQRHERLVNVLVTDISVGLVFEGFTALGLAGESAAVGMNGLNTIRSPIARASKGNPGFLLPESSLTRRQLAIHRTLQESGATGSFAKRAVSMRDLHAIGRVTGDEYSMYTLGSRRFVIRGFGNEIRVTEGLATDLEAGKYGRWSGHTHPPGYDINPSTLDRQRLPLGQTRSAIWGDGGEGYKVFYGVPAEDSVFEAAQRREQFRRFYEGH